MQYDATIIQPFRDELTRIGFRELRSAAEVDTTLAKKGGTNFLVINSVCGCAAGKARPGIAMALRSSPMKPDELTTVFAGGDIEATARVRERIGSLPPSSPSMALFKDGQLVHFVPRYQIENRDAAQIGRHLMDVFQEYCGGGSALAAGGNSSPARNENAGR
jgi:putative YphP/YqiW family bacilliredoxin